MTERAITPTADPPVKPESAPAPEAKRSRKKAKRARGQSPGGNALMPLAIGVVAMALGAATVIQLGWPVWQSIVFALGAFVAFSTFNILVQRTRTLDQLDSEVRALRLEVEQLQGLVTTGSQPPLRNEHPGTFSTAPQQQTLRAPTPRMPPVPAIVERTDSRVQTSDREPAALRGMLQQAASPASAPWAFRPDVRDAVHVGPLAAAAPLRRADPQLPPLGLEPRKAGAPGAPEAADPFSFRPATVTTLSDVPRGDEDPATRPWQKAPERAAKTMQPVPPASTGLAEDSIERIQQLIKKLADDVNGAEAAESRAAEPPVAANAATAPKTRRAEAGASSAERAAESAMQALVAAATTMREQIEPSPAPAPEPAAPPPALAAPRAAPAAESASAATASPVSARSVSDAIAAERLDVFLDPIQMLGDRRPRHFELSMQLRDGQGRLLQGREMLAAAREAGLTGRLEALKLNRATRFATLLRNKGREGSVISTVTGEVLGDDAFLDSVADALGDGGQTTVVLAFEQADVRAFGPIHWETLSVITELGVRFMLTEVVDLDLDFQRLGAAGFQFVKLDAGVFLDGLPMEAGVLPSTDVCSHIANAGLDLIIGGIGTEWTLARVAAFGVAYGQGALFGAPKPVKAEMLAPVRTAA